MKQESLPSTSRAVSSKGMPRISQCRIFFPGVTSSRVSVWTSEEQAKKSTRRTRAGDAPRCHQARKRCSPLPRVLAGMIATKCGALSHRVQGSSPGSVSFAEGDVSSFASNSHQLRICVTHCLPASSWVPGHGQNRPLHCHMPIPKL